MRDAVIPMSLFLLRCKMTRRCTASCRRRGNQNDESYGARNATAEDRGYFPHLQLADIANKFV
jgi:hypothetical protein